MGLLDFFSDAAKRYGEPALAIGSGVVAEPLAGWYGLLGGGGDGVRAARDTLTYVPRTSVGQQSLRDLGGLVEDAKTVLVDKNPPVKLALDAYNRVADAAGERSPLLGAVVRTAPAALGMLASPGGARFVQGLGERAAAQGVDALVDTADAFRQTRRGADMSVAERAAMNDMTQGVYDALRDSGQSANSLKPALSLAQHLPTGELRLGLNRADGLPPEALSPLLEPRIARMPSDVLETYKKTRGAGSHAEVYAVNDLLNDLLGAKPEEIAVRTIDTGPLDFRGTYKPPCPHCGYILDGVYPISD